MAFSLFISCGCCFDSQSSKRRVEIIEHLSNELSYIISKTDVKVPALHSGAYA